MLKARSETAPYDATLTTEAEDRIIEAALGILARRVRVRETVFGSPQAVKDYLCLRIGDREHEVFGVMLLDAQHRLIEACEMFRGTLTQTSVYPREIVKLALDRNAAALVLYHNHPSGTTEPSRADEALTQTLKAACALVDVRILDHIVCAGCATVSFAERGLL